MHDVMEEESVDNGANFTFRQQLKDSAYRRKFIHSLVLFLSNICLGVRRGQHAPAFLDLAQITRTNMEQASVFYTAMSVGTLAGTFSMGFLFDKLPGHRYFVLAVTCILGAVSTTAIPWSRNYFLTVFIFFINSCFDGGYDTGANANLLSTWGVDGKVFMQFLHFSFSLGTIVSPFTVQPFVSHASSDNSTFCQQSLDNQVNSPGHYYSINDTQKDVRNAILNTTTNISFSQKDCVLSESRIHFAYLIAGALCLFSGAIIVVEGCLSPRTTKKYVQNKEQQRNKHKLPTWLKMIVLVLIAIIYFFHSSSVYSIFGYIMVFSVNGLGWSKDRGTRLSSVFWAGYAASRLLGVVVIKWLSPSKIMLVSTSTVVLSFLGLWLSVVLNWGWGVWVGIFLSALGSGVIFATGIIYLETEVMKVTGRITSVIWIAVSVQGMMTPPFLGFLMLKVSFMWYIYLVIIQGTVCFLAYFILMIMVKTLVSKYNSVKVQTLTDEDHAAEISLEKAD